MDSLSALLKTVLCPLLLLLFVFVSVIVAVVVLVVDTDLLSISQRRGVLH